MNRLLNLPPVILDIIYSYDDKNKNIFKNEINRDIWRCSWEKKLENYIVPDKDYGDYGKDKDGSMQIQTKNGEASIAMRFALSYVYKHMDDNDDNVYYTDEISVSGTNEYDEFIRIRIYGNRKTLFDGRVFTKEQLSEYIASDHYMRVTQVSWVNNLILTEKI